MATPEQISEAITQLQNDFLQKQQPVSWTTYLKWNRQADGSEALYKAIASHVAEFYPQIQMCEIMENYSCLELNTLVSTRLSTASQYYWQQKRNDSDFGSDPFKVPHVINAVQFLKLFDQHMKQLFPINSLSSDNTILSASKDTYELVEGVFAEHGIAMDIFSEIKRLQDLQCPDVLNLLLEYKGRDLKHSWPLTSVLLQLEQEPSYVQPRKLNQDFSDDLARLERLIEKRISSFNKDLPFSYTEMNGVTHFSPASRDKNIEADQQVQNGACIIL